MHTQRCGDIFCSTHCNRELRLNAQAQPSLVDGTPSKVCQACYQLGYEAPLPEPPAAALAASAQSAIPVAASSNFGRTSSVSDRAAQSDLVVAEPPHLALAPVSDLPAELSITGPADPFVHQPIHMSSFIDSIGGAFSLVTLLGDIISQMPQPAARLEVIAAHGDELETACATLDDALHTLGRLLDASVERAMPDAPAARASRTVYNYLVCLMADTEQGLLWLRTVRAAAATAAESAAASAMAHSAGAATAAPAAAAAAAVAASAGASATVAAAEPAGADAAGASSLSAAQATADASVRAIEADVEARATALLTAGDEPSRQAALQQMRFVRVQLEAARDKLSSRQDFGPDAPQVRRLADALAYCDSVLAAAPAELSVLTGDLAAPVQQLEAELFAVLAATDAVNRDAAADVAALRERLVCLIRNVGACRVRLELFASGTLNDDALRASARLEDLQENLASLELTFERKFGELAALRELSDEEEQLTNVQQRAELTQTRVAHARIENDMFDL